MDLGASETRGSVQAGFFLGNRPLGGSSKPLLVAEVAQAHDGSLGIAHSFIDAAAAAGADAIKFQTHIAAAESTPEEQFRIKFSYEDATRYDYWRRMEFTAAQWKGLADHAKDCGLLFLSTPFSVEAIDLLDAIGTPAWKIGSGETTNSLLLERCLRSGKPILLSTGMSNWKEIDATVALIREAGNDFCLFQCTSMYPTPLERVGINCIDLLRRRYDAPVGLSDHSGSIFPPLAALAHGASIVEFHVAFDKQMFGPDSSSSLTFAELAMVAKGRDAFYVMDHSPMDKDGAADELGQMRRLFTKSLALREPLAAGTVLREEHLTAKKPGTGISPEQLKNLVGRRLKRDTGAEQLLTWQDLHDVG